MLQGFKTFISRGNAVDLAVGIVIGAAFGAVVTSLNENVLLPLIAAVIGEPDFSDVGAFTLNGSSVAPGAFVTALLNFVLIAAAVYFFVVVPMNALAERTKRTDPAAAEPASPTELELLMEIRDALTSQGRS